MKNEQTVLGKTGTLIFLVVISAFPPLTTDLYLPAMPQMVESFETTTAMMNLTLSIYFIAYAAGLLFWGPLSEKFGRKPIMMIGLWVFLVASLLCANSSNIGFLIFSRLLQAFGGSAVTVVSTAIVKDLYDGREREKAMATIMSLVVIAPMVAPVLGAAILKVASWHMMFYVLAIFGALATIFAMFYKESLADRYQGSVVKSWGRLAVVLRNSDFVFLLMIFSIPPMAMMAFLAAGSYIYIQEFGMTEQQFSFIFAFNALFAAFGPMIYMKVSRCVSVRRIVSVCFALIACSGIILVTAGYLSPWLLTISCAFVTLAAITTRVPGANLMLDQQEKDTGSVAALIQFFGMMMGSAGMLLISAYPEQLIQCLGIIQLIVGIFGFTLWLWFCNQRRLSPEVDLTHLLQK